MAELVVKSATSADGTFSATGTTVWDAGMRPDSGQLSVPFGGTGAATLTGLLEGNGTSAVTAFAMGTGVKTALGINTGSAGAVVLFNGALGTPTSGTATNLTGLPLTTGVTGDLPLSNLAQASAASKLLGRGDSGAGDYQEITLGSGLTMTGTTLSSSGGSGYATIQDEGSSLTQRATFNFIGSGVVAADDAGNSRTNITINGATSDIIFADAPNSDFDLTNGGGGGAVTIITKSVTGITAKDSIVVDIYYTLINNSGGVRTYTLASSLGSLTVTAPENATIAAGTGRNIRHTCLEFAVSATNLTYGLISQLAHGPLSVAADTQAPQTSNSTIGVWDSSSSDLTGTQTVSFTMASSSTTTTQTLTLHSYVIRKVSQL